MVFVHIARPAGLQFRRIQWRARRLCMGLAVLRVHRLSGVAHAGTRGAAGAVGSPVRLAVLEAGMPPHASTPLFDVPTAPGMETVVISAGAPIDGNRAVAAAEPTHLVGYATVIGQLARASLAGELDIRPVRVSTNSEPLLDEDRQAIARRGTRRFTTCGVHRDRRAGGRLRRRRGAACLRGRGCPGTRRRQRRARRSRRAGRPNAGHRTCQSHIPVHSL